MGDGLWVMVEGVWKRKGRPDRGSPAPFVLGTTRPGKQIVGAPFGRTEPDTDYVGVDYSLGDPEPYTGTGAGSSFTISSPTTFIGVDFGTTFIDIRANDVVFEHCKWTNSHVQDRTTATLPEGVCTMRYGGTFTGRYFYRCEFDNVSQWSPSTVALIGHGYTAERCWIRNFGDCGQIICPTSTPDALVNVEWLGCWLGDLSWWWAPTVGPVHPSTQHQHCDCLQWQGGKGVRIEGCDVMGHYSTTLGTGSPNSGNDTGGVNAASAPYDQATGEAKWYEIVEGSGTYSAGQWGEFLGGSISGLMFSQSAAGTIVDGDIVNNWGSGGAYWLNAGGTDGDPFGTVTGNRVVNNQRTAGWAIGIHTGLTCTYADNVWMDDGTPIPRKNA